jgi:ComF family protein
MVYTSLQKVYLTLKNIREYWIERYQTIPTQCMLCHIWTDKTVCPACIHHFTQWKPRCLSCALPIANEGGLCGTCRQKPTGFKTCVATQDYVYPWDYLIRLFKFNGQYTLASTLVTLMLKSSNISKIASQADYLIPVPLHAKRLAYRGYNQSDLLAKQIGKQLAKPKNAVLASAILRKKNTLPQVELKATKRQANVQNAFVPSQNYKYVLQDKNILLVDDVMTTGTTLSACLDALNTLRPASVHAVVFARTPNQ